MGGDDGRDRLPAAARRLAAQGVVPHDRHRRRRRRDRGPRGLLVRTAWAFSRPRALVRGLRLRRDAVAQLRRLRRGARRLHRGDLAIDVLGPVGTRAASSFFAIDRAIEICIGIVCAGVVLALTDLGHSRRKLAAEFAALSAAIWMGLPIVCRRGATSQVQRPPSRPLAARHRARSHHRRGDRGSFRPALPLGRAADGLSPASWDALRLAQGRVRDRRKGLKRTTEARSRSRPVAARAAAPDGTNRLKEPRRCATRAARRRGR